MMGKDFDDLAAIKHSGEEERNFDGEDIVIKAAGLGKQGYIKPFDLVIRKGEVIGLTGLLGSGRSETVRVIYGAENASNVLKSGVTVTIDAEKGLIRSSNN